MRRITKKLIFNGVSSEELGLVIQAPPSYDYPERDVNITHIPGRNGDLVVDNKCYKNITRMYNLAKGFGEDVKHFVPNAEDILAWLTSAKGKYVRLEDDYDPEVYRMAMYNANGSFSNYYDKGLAIGASFECKPQRFLKIGEDPIEFTGISVSLNNYNHYESLPLIKVSGVNTSTPGTLIMMTVKAIKENNEEEVTASISLTDIQSNENVYIDSDIQNCYNDATDINEKVGLNGGDFPKLGIGETTEIDIKKYNETRAPIDKYDSLIKGVGGQSIIKSEYLPKEKVATINEEKVYVDSWNNLVEKKCIKYDAPSIQALGTSDGSKYTFESYNSLLSAYSSSFTFTGKAGENDFPDWITATDSSDNVVLAVPSGKSGFYSLNTSKRISYYASGATIATVSSNLTTTINYYEATTMFVTMGGYTWHRDFRFDNMVIPNLPSNFVYAWSYGQSIMFTSSESPNTGANTFVLTTPTSPIESGGNITGSTIGLKVNYTDMPDWLDCIVTYKTIDDILTPSKIEYVTRKSGYFWTDKTWLFGKSKWSKITDRGTVLNSLSWSTTSKAFMPDNMLSLSKTATFTYYYFDPSTLTYPTTETGIEPPFTIEYLGTTLDEIILKTKNAGYYAVSLNDGEYGAWSSSLSAGAQILKIKGTDSFAIKYLSALPTYASDEWPTWLNAVPVLTPSGSLNPTSINFKAAQTSYYRYSYIDNNEEKYTEFVQVNSGNNIITSAHPKDANSSFYICRIDAPPQEYGSNNRGYTTDAGSTTATVPSWLNVTYNLDDPNNKTITYKVGTLPSSGKLYLKWDNNSSWVKYTTIGETLLTTGYEDDTIFYKMETLPSYNVSSLPVNLTPVEDPTTGNPIEVKFTVKSANAGYYRINSSPDWIYHEGSDLIYTASVFEDVVLHYLTATTDPTGITITITPRWWML